MIVFQKKHFDIIPDNDEVYFEYLLGVLEAIDEYTHIQATKIASGYNIRISASAVKYNSAVLKELLRLHTLLGLHIDISKSIKSSGVISYKILLDDGI